MNGEKHNCYTTHLVFEKTFLSAMAANDVWPAIEACRQLEGILWRRLKLENDKYQPKKPLIIDDVVLAMLNPLTKVPDCTKAIAICQSWIASFVSPSSLAALFTRLMTVSDCLSPPIVDVEEAKEEHAPSSKDKAATVDDLVDDSVDFIVLDTIHRAVQSLLARWQQRHTREEEKGAAAAAAAGEGDPLPGVTDAMLRFCFDRCGRYDVSAGTRHKASECIALLSSCYMQPIIIIFCGKMEKVKKDADEREFTLFQKVQTVAPRWVECSSLTQHARTLLHLSFAAHRRLLLSISTLACI